jgi:iron complex transport system ATP-binding protein
VLDGAAVLAGIDLDVAAGEWVGVIGPNGAGKTTMLRAVQGAVDSSGRVAVLGRPLAGLTAGERARLVASVAQRPVVPADLRVVDYVLLGRNPHIRYLAAERPADLAAVRMALEALDLAPLASRRLGHLSGGEIQRVVLARALAQEAPILLLDEPTAALDVGHQQHVLALVDRLRRERGLATVAALHDLTLAAQFCDRLVMLAGGRVVAEGAARHVLTESAIRQHYGATVRVLDDGRGGVVVIPVRDSGPVRDRGTMVAESHP